MQHTIEDLYNGTKIYKQDEFSKLFQNFINELNTGQIRTAKPTCTGWQVNSWVKQGILLGFRYGKLKEYSINNNFNYFDKNTYPLRPIDINNGIRIVPGGSSIRNGSFIASGVVIMPPAYINTGAYVDTNTMIDSHALVGSCAQIGKEVHLSAASQIGGVLEPIGALPVIIEDNVFIGGNSGIYEGSIVKRNAVIGAGTILTSSIPVYDLIQQKIIRSSKKSPLIIPENAVVVPGSRPIKNSNFAVELNLHISCAIIIKYRDESTDVATILEEALR